MKKLILSVTAISLAAGAFAADNANDKVLMKVNGHDVKVSEFLYLYNKNNSQQLQPQTVDEYVDMFVDYKLKVADAEAAGIDTTAAFRAEYAKFRNELAAPYLRDKSVEDALLNEAYSHFNKEVSVSHIMIPVNRSLGFDAMAQAHIDSIRVAIVAGEISFEDAAEKYSVDTPTAKKGGMMGWLPVGRFPWAFEKAAYDTPVGGVSPVLDSGFGLHIVKVNAERPARGEVHVAHILKMTRDLPENQVAAQKLAIDSIYNVLIGGADFADVARTESQDPGSARNGGDLGWFGGGVMVAEFDSVAFALADGEISRPFPTSFGYHIIKRFDHRGVEPFEQAREKLMAAMARDGRADEPRKARLKQLAEKYHVTMLKANSMALNHRLSHAPVDSVTLAVLAVDTTPLARVGEAEITVAEAFAPISSMTFANGASLAASIDKSVQTIVDNLLTEKEINQLEVDNVDYRNLINEYRDGILLFEISNNNVWDRATKDREGLEKFFRDNASRYTWDAPRFKGYVIFAANDSILGEAIRYADTLSTDDPETFVADIRKQFGKNIKIERVIAAKGENPITDFLAFGGEKPEAKNPRWSSYSAYKGRVIDRPEEAADVRGAAATDYQAQLEQQWLKQLHKRYPVKIDKKILKSVKESETKK